MDSASILLLASVLAFLLVRRQVEAKEEQKEQSLEMDNSISRPSKIEQVSKLRQENSRPDSSWPTKVQRQLAEQALLQKMSDKDHTLMEKWLVDNINDLHRELKQTESDFEHYVQVTKKFIEKNELLMSPLIASGLSVPIPVSFYELRGQPGATLEGILSSKIFIGKRGDS